MNRVTAVAAAVDEVRSRIDDAARRGGRRGSDVTLIGVTKTRGIDDIEALIAADVRDLGENRARELCEKADLVGHDVRWHMIGQCQTNKVGVLAPHVTLWHTVDRLALVEVLARRAPGAQVLVQVDLSNDPGRGGVAPTGVDEVVAAGVESGLAVAGLMAVAPLGVDPRPGFEMVARLRSTLGLAELSIGMTDDFEIAVEVGATLVRVGRALFAERNPDPGSRR